MKNYMLIALSESKKCLKHGDVPVGAIIVKNNKIIARAHNMKNKKNNPLAHAEIIAINKACKKINNWRLDDTIMYVTLEPCNMCKSAIESARISYVFYGTSKINTEIKKTSFVMFSDHILTNKCSQEIRKFFKEIRKK